MREFSYTIKNDTGLHGRPAGLLVREVKNHKSEVIVYKGEDNVNALRLMALMNMGIERGDTVRITVQGEDEESCVEELESFFKENL